jgi:hypothetical membrane protein
MDWVKIAQALALIVATVAIAAALIGIFPFSDADDEGDE